MDVPIGSIVAPFCALRLLRGSWALRVWALGAKVWDLITRVQEH